MCAHKERVLSRTALNRRTAALYPLRFWPSDQTKNDSQSRATNHLRILSDRSDKSNEFCSGFNSTSSHVVLAEHGPVDSHKPNKTVDIRDRVYWSHKERVPISSNRSHPASFQPIPASADQTNRTKYESRVTLQPSDLSSDNRRMSPARKRALYHPIRLID